MKILDKIMSNKKLCIIVSIVIVVCICLFIYFYNNSKFIEKKDNKKGYVYTIKQYENAVYGDNYYDEVPAINLVGEKFDKLNTSIMDNYYSVSKMTEYNYDYEYSRSGNILALKITYAYYENDTDDEAIRYFQTIHIDLKTGKILSDEDILNKFNVTKEDVNTVLDKDFKMYYDNLVAGKFYTRDECDYNCFLNNRGITTNYSDGVSYYIQDGVLTVFKFFNTTSSYGEEEYFYSEDYQFVVKE